MADGFQLHDPIRKFSNLCVFGPMARSVEDVCLALQIISGPNDRDPEVPPLTWQEVPPLVLQDLRIAFVSTFPQTKVARDIRMAIEGFAQSLDGLCIRTAPLQTEQETRVDGVTIPQGQGIHPANLLRLQDILRL